MRTGLGGTEALGPTDLATLAEEMPASLLIDIPRIIDFRVRISSDLKTIPEVHQCGPEAIARALPKPTVLTEKDISLWFTKPQAQCKPATSRLRQK